MEQPRVRSGILHHNGNTAAAFRATPTGAAVQAAAAHNSVVASAASGLRSLRVNST
jgi:hypothetical protein